MRLFLSLILFTFSFSQHAFSQEIKHLNALGVFYSQHEGEPIWVHSGHLNAKGDVLLKTLEDSWQNGLNPDRYHLKAIHEILSHDAFSEPLGAGRGMDLEVLLTDAYLSYVKDVSAMRVRAYSSELSLRSKDWPLPQSDQSLLGLLVEDKNDDFSAFLGSFEPQGYVYQALKEMLKSYAYLSEKRYHQIIVNMERLRWMPQKMPERYIMVNIAAAHLWGIDDGALVVDMPVVVGRKARQTELFVTHVNGVRFNPSWTVPETIKREDIVPKLAQDSNYLLHKGMELYSGYGSDTFTLDPTSISWDGLTKAELRGFRFVQAPGENNPLGRYRVLMPNAYNIYLHDTNEKHVFARGYDGRAVSSGCVRLKEPKKLVSFILSGRDHVSDPHVQKILDSKREREIHTQDKIPVYMLYYTIWPGDNDGIVFGKDIYGRDKKLLQVLDKLDAFQKFDNNKFN